MTTAQISGHLFGPPAPHIAFWFGDYYLGEVRGHPSDVQAAQSTLLRQLDILEPGDREGKRARLLSYTHVKVYCGSTTVEVRGHAWFDEMWNPLASTRRQQLRARAH